MNKRHVVALSAALLAACGSPEADAPELEQLGSAKQELLNAPFDPGHKFAVGVCAGPLSPNGACEQEGTRCTGTLVAPNLVLTARHCVHQIDYSEAVDFCSGRFTTDGLTAETPRITTAASVLQPNPGWRKVKKVLTPTDATSCSGDVALLVLETRVPSSEALPAVMLPLALSSLRPQKVAIVGRGNIDETFDTEEYVELDSDNGGLKRRVLRNVPVVCIPSATRTCTVPDIGADFTLPYGYFAGGPATAQGDSGSGVFAQPFFDLQLPAVIGVVSAGTYDPVTGKPAASLFTRLDSHATFLARGLVEASR